MMPGFQMIRQPGVTSVIAALGVLSISPRLAGQAADAPATRPRTRAVAPPPPPVPPDTAPKGFPELMNRALVVKINRLFRL